MIGATFRLQFREGTGFAEAAELVPELAAMGITHFYASPIFAATEGSTHGYDVTDHNAFDPVLGGEAGFLRLSDTLRAHGLKLMLDIVPNHMAASPQNPWWRDVLQHGPQSRFASHFDIDWTAPRLILPILGKPYGEAIRDGDIARGEHPEWGPVLTVHGMAFPLRPGTEEIADVHACHEAQHYRLAHWRLGRDGLTYRRFFEITGLVGVRVEDPAVFDDVHALTLSLIAEGRLHALRVDHVDGLADPAGYLERLAAVAKVPVLVEKILEPGEELPPWPVDGTTGYEFIAALAGLFVDPEGLALFAREYGALASDDVTALVHRAKHEIINHNLAGELLRLTDLARTVFADDPMRRDHGPFTLREGLSALLAGMPVYRTYITEAAGAQDLALLAEAAEEAHKEPLDSPQVVDDLVHALTEPRDTDAGREFVTRFQQTSGPLMAKALEDTVFFRHHRFVGLNEVGGASEPQSGTALYLAVAAERGLAATQTHDTKRGEDARARLYALSDPAAAARFAPLANALPGDVPAGLKWGLAQMLFASWPLEPDPDFPRRFCETALKTVREAKEETSWTAQNGPFEARVHETAERLASGEDPFASLEDVRRAGAVIGLSQVVLKCFGRRPPDFYQGTFGWDLAMVDPDNRRPVDFDARRKLIEMARVGDPDALMADWRSGAIKARLTIEALALRRERPSLFARGALKTLDLGPASPLTAFLCEDGVDAALAVVATRPLPLLGDANLGVALPESSRIALDRPFACRLTGMRLSGESTEIARHFSRFPVLLAATL